MWLRVDRDVIDEDGTLHLCATRYFACFTVPEDATAVDLLATVRDYWQIENCVIVIKIAGGTRIVIGNVATDFQNGWRDLPPVPRTYCVAFITFPAAPSPNPFNRSYPRSHDSGLVVKMQSF
jgi:hypothetical protein